MFGGHLLDRSPRVHIYILYLQANPPDVSITSGTPNSALNITFNSAPACFFYRSHLILYCHADIQEVIVGVNYFSYNNALM